MKYLVIGSAPYIKNWYSENGKKYLDAGYKLVAINNAWVIDMENLHFWVHANDFYMTGSLIPTREEKEILDKVEKVSEVRGINKYEATNIMSGTMILNVIIGLVNRALMKNMSLEVCVAGCDLNYEEKENHFYGAGDNDPMRLGKPFLKEELEKTKEIYEKEGFLIFNVGGQEKTLLPFERKAL